SEMVSSLDRALMSFWRKFQGGTHAANTSVILTADHGELLSSEGAHTGHGVSHDEAVIHVPLILWMPGRSPGGDDCYAATELRAVAPIIRGAMLDRDEPRRIQCNEGTDSRAIAIVETWRDNAG